jgi:hypothetical protein
MLEIIEDGIFLPEIIHANNWDLTQFKEKSKLITYIDAEDVSSNNICTRRPQRIEAKYASVWSTSKPGTIGNYLCALEGIGSLPVISLDHVFWLTDNRHDLLNKTEQNEKGDYIGNFFFISKSELEINSLDSEIVVASVIRRNITTSLQFGIRFYTPKDPRIFSAKDRRIFSLA